MKKHILPVFLFLTMTASAQSTFDRYTWDSRPATGNPDTVKSKDGAVIMLERHMTEVFSNDEGYFEEIGVFHKKIKTETTQAIDDYNKIYIPVDNVREILAIRARFISPSGKVTELPQESIRLVENLENKGDFKAFAIEGAEAGGAVEYYYILRKKFRAYGTEYLQEDVPKSGVEVIFTYPSKLEYMIKSYNGFPSFVFSKGENESTTARAEIPYIPALDKEAYSYYKARLMRFEYVMAFNRFNTSLRVYSWAKACRNMYSNTFEFSKKELSAIRKQLKAMNLPDGPEEARVRAIEHWVKAEINISGENPGDLPLEVVLKLRHTDKHGAVRLFNALFRESGIAFELVIGSDNEEQPFDPEFNSFNFLKKYLLYIPSTGKYLVPDDDSYRLGLMPENMQGAYALFTWPVEPEKDLKTLAHEVRRLPVNRPGDHADSLFQEIRLDETANQLKVNTRRVFTGIIAANFQSFWHLLDNDRKKEIVSSVFNMGKENTTVESYELQNATPDHIALDPLVWKVTVTANNLVESAGNDLLVKIGETIGAQSELYQEGTRKLPVDVGLPRSYYRTIRFEVPAAWRIANIDDLQMDVRMMVGDELSCLFRSKATMSGNTLNINIEEYYTEVFYPLEKYEEFRNVINAAADYNKKTLILKRL